MADGAAGTVVTVGLADGALSGAGPPRWPVLRERAFPGTCDNRSDGSGPGALHACAVASAIAAGGAPIRYVCAPVFGATLHVSASDFAAALDWLADARPDVVHISAGIRSPGPALRHALDALLAAVPAVVASAPARGMPVFPAVSAGVISATGDARCATEQWSWLNGAGSAWGASAVSTTDPAIGGASIGAAHFTGHLCRALLNARMMLPDALDALRTGAAFHGPERRGTAGARHQGVGSLARR